MADEQPRIDQLSDSPHALALVVGCEFEFEALQPVAAVMQVAPWLSPGVRIQREEWHTSSDHHGYLAHYENRCERFTIGAGRSKIAYEALLLLTDPADLIDWTRRRRRWSRCPTKP